MTKEEITICKMYLEEMGKDKDCNEYKLLMQMLEQQPSDDCVDRNHVIATISQHHFDKDKDNFDLLIHNLCKEINELPPVTPTHGTCKDCVKGHKYKNIDECFCDYLRDDFDTDFYCADFERRED